jgi:Zn-dependent peptidase ImmA (M78 family)
MGKFLPARLKKAREDAGLTQEAFAHSLGLSSEFISLLESGKRAPSLDTLSRIASRLNRDAAFFLGEREPAFTILFRAASLDDPARSELVPFQRYVEDYLRLERETGRRLELAPLYADIPAGRLAAEERRRLGLGDEPIRDIFGLLERNGCRILRRPMPPEAGISGVFIFLEAEAAAFVLINAAQPLCRQIFTAAHEYCHYLKDRHDGPVIDGPNIFGEGSAPAPNGKERFAQEFAAHFLMPPSKVREVVDKEFGPARRLSYDDVLLVKRVFGVSAQAILRTLRDLDLLTAAQFEDYWRRDPLPREREVFGGSGEECPVLAAGGLPEESDGVIVSDRFKLLKKMQIEEEQ